MVTGIFGPTSVFRGSGGFLPAFSISGIDPGQLPSAIVSPSRVLIVILCVFFVQLLSAVSYGIFFLLILGVLTGE